nr:hypothetical protein [Tanacetum cinerariifolium]
MIKKQVGKTIKHVMPYYISQTTKNLKEIVRKELEEFKKGGIMNDFRNEMATYHDFTACDVPMFDGVLDLIASTRWLAAVEGGFRTSNYKEKNKVNFASNFLRDSAKMWWEGKVYENDEEWIGSETVNEMWKKFNDLFAIVPSTMEIRRLRLKDSKKCYVMILERRKSKEAKETKRKLIFRDRDAKKLKQDHNRRSGRTQIKTPFKST